MRLINTASLIRGATLVDYALLDEDHNFDLTVQELIGVVAAYAARGKHPVHIEEELAKRLTPAIATKAMQVLTLFNDWNGGGLWLQGPAYDDFSFTNDRLIRMYPGVNQARERISESA